MDTEIDNIQTENSKYSKAETLIYCWGKNKEGELSLGHTKSINRPRHPKGLKQKYVSSLSCGGQHSGLVTVDGELYLTGSALHGKLGFEDLDVTCLVKFRRLDELSDMRVKQVACGDYHTLCLLESGKVFAWGGTLHKKLGQRAGRPGIIATLEKKIIISVDCGDFHSAALTNKGELYTWGGGGAHFNKGQLGQGTLNDIENPEIVKFFEGDEVKAISCGGFHTIALTKNGAFGWGSGTYGELGIGEFIDISKPRPIQIKLKGAEAVEFANPEDTQIAKVPLSFLILVTGLLYSCGYGSHGQLGLRTLSNFADPQLVYALSKKKTISVAVGWNHSLAVTSENAVYCCGYGSSGQLGLGDARSRTVFTQIGDLGGKRVTELFAGGNFSWALLDHNSPDIIDYQPPSPLRLTAHDLSKSKDLSKPMGESMNDVFSKFTIDPHFNETGLLICYSEVTFCHCFVSFTASDYVSQKTRFHIESYMEELQRDTEVAYHTLRENTQIMEETEDGEMRVLQRDEPDGHRSFTLMIITKQAEIDIPRLEGKSVQSSVGELVYVKLENLTGSNWLRLFSTKFESTFKSMKFFELRPDSQ